MASIGRRDFLKLVGAGSLGAGAGFLYGESTKKTVEYLIPQVVAPEDHVPGIATWYRSVCRQCPAGCGIVVRNREGRAKKIEGNPVHPVSQGRICARGQAGLNALYNPDRIREPLRRDGDGFTTTSWDEVLAELGRRLYEMRIANDAGKVYLLSDGVRGHLDELFARFMQEFGSPNYLQYEATHEENLYAANARPFALSHLPYYDIRNADCVLSFGADFLATWKSPVHYSLAYGHMRQGRRGRRGHLIQVEPRMSLTGANADEWLHARPGTEGMVALAIARQLVSGGYYDGGDHDAWAAALEGYTTQRVAAEADIPAARLEQAGERFAAAEAKLALGGGAAGAGTNGYATLLAVNALNHLAGAWGGPGGVLFNPPPAFGAEAVTRLAGFGKMRELVEAMQSGQVDVLIIHQTNPAFTLPAFAGFRDALAKVPMVVSLASFMDETAAMADLVLPTRTYLESWWDDAPEPGVGLAAAAVAQPVVQPLYDCMSSGDIVLALAKQVGGELPAALPWNDTEEYLRAAWKTIFESRAPGEAGDFDSFWNEVLRAGAWATAGEPVASPEPDATLAAELALPEPAFSGSADEFPFALHPYHTATFLDGRGANLPWLQELPDQMTSVVYDSWLEMNPATAASLGLREGDIVEVASTAGSLRGAVLPYEGIRPDVVAMPVGQGHTDYGRYASGRGADPLGLLADKEDEKTGAFAWAATRVRVTPTGERVQLIKTGGRGRDLGRQILGPPA